MIAANKLFLSVGLVAASVSFSETAHAQYFSYGGRAGDVSEFFLQSVKPTGVGDNRFVKVIDSNNKGQKKRKDFVVNCNDSMPQILDSDNVNVKIDIKNYPSNATMMYWDLWHAACHKDFAKSSKRQEVRDNLVKLSITTEPEFNGTPYSVHYQSLNYSESLANLVKIDAFKGKKPFDTAFVYCNDDNPTVYWKTQKAMIGISDLADVLNSEISDKGLITLSETLWNGACKSVSTNTTGQRYIQQEASSSETSEPEATIPEPEVIAKPTGNKPPKNAENSISNAYETYMLTKLFCEYHYAGDRQLAPLKTKLKQLDGVAKSQKIDVEGLWQKATKNVEKDTNYQLMQAYKAFPIEYQDRIKFSNGCEQMTRMLSGSIDLYLSESSGGKKTGIEKDF